MMAMQRYHAPLRAAASGLVLCGREIAQESKSAFRPSAAHLDLERSGSRPNLSCNIEFLIDSQISNR
jgi:hypothetical protein